MLDTVVVLTVAISNMWTLRSFLGREQVDIVDEPPDQFRQW